MIIIYLPFKLVHLHKRHKFVQNLKSIAGEKFKNPDTGYSLHLKRMSLFSSELVAGETKPFPAASLIKLPILAAAFYAVDQEKVSLDDMITIKKNDVAGGSGKIKALSLPRRLTFGQLMEWMIALSDNTATNKVIEILGLDYINDTFKRLGLSDTTLVRKMMDFSLRKKGLENYTSSSDIIALLEKIYRGRLINKKFSSLALSFLKRQKVNDRLPRYLPSRPEVVVAHKTGLERGVVHDAGIIFSPGGDYLICILVKGVKNYTQAKNFIAQISLLTYNLYK